MSDLGKRPFGHPLIESPSHCYTAEEWKHDPGNYKSLSKYMYYVSARGKMHWELSLNLQRGHNYQSLNLKYQPAVIVDNLVERWFSLRHISLHKEVIILMSNVLKVWYDVKICKFKKCQ